MSLDILTRACQAAINANTDFWLLAAITDQSCEEGTRSSRAFGRSVAAYEDVGLAPGVLADLKKGMNGVLADCIATMPGVDSVRQNPSRAPDILFRAGDSETWVECKHVYDCTFTKQFSQVVPADGEKLLRLRSEGRILAQVVFFVQLPMYYYPLGKWYGDKPCKDRGAYLVTTGVSKQFSRLQRHMRQLPFWPDNPPFIRPLHPIGDSAESAMQRWFANVFSPAVPWTFDAATQLRDAAVGVAIWAY